MISLKCKICGGDLELIENQSVAICQHCGTKQTLPRISDDQRRMLYNRANEHRRNCLFDEALSEYERIVQEDPEDPEAYWGLVLCRYGVEYVEVSEYQMTRRVPTIHRFNIKPIFEDEDYNRAIQYSNEEQREILRKDAAAINTILERYLRIVSSEAPFDAFICYKESDNGRRTEDSAKAQEIYEALTDAGLKVFFSRITLENKTGEDYEPYIFSALQSAKVLILVCPTVKYAESVWVANEWTRFLMMMQNDNSKVLIPCCNAGDIYALPKRLRTIQAHDMNKIGFQQDLVQRVLMCCGKTATTVRPGNTANYGADIDNLVRFGYSELMHEDWKSASRQSESILNIDYKNIDGYLIKLLADLKLKSPEELNECGIDYESNENYQKIIRYCENEARREEFRRCMEDNKKLSVHVAAKKKFSMLVSELESADDVEQIERIKQNIQGLSGVLDVSQATASCDKKIQDILEQQRAQLVKDANVRKKTVFTHQITIIVVVAVLIVFGIITNSVPTSLMPKLKAQNIEKALETKNKESFNEEMDYYFDAHDSTYKKASEDIDKLLVEKAIPMGGGFEACVLDGDWKGEDVSLKVDNRWKSNRTIVFEFISPDFDFGAATFEIADDNRIEGSYNFGSEEEPQTITIKWVDLYHIDVTCEATGQTYRLEREV